MSGPAGAEGIRAGDRVVIDGRPQVVLGASGTAIRFAGDDGIVEEAAVAELAGSGRLRQPRPAGGRPGPQIGLAGLPPEMVGRARWWEDHIIEVVDGTRPDASAGTPPRPEYDVEGNTLRQREQAKAAELSAPGRPVSASTVKHRRQRWQAEGLPGLVDRRVTQRRSPAGRADPAVAGAMEQAIAEATDESSRTATFIVWRTRQLLAERGQADREPSRATMFRLFSRLSAGRRTTAGAGGGGPGGTAAADVLPGLPGGAGRADGDRLHAPGRHGAAGRRGAGAGGADRDDRRGDQDGARGGAAPHDEVGRRERAAGPRAHARADAPRVAGEPGDGALGPAL